MRARLLAAAAVVGGTLAGASIAVARGTLFSDTGALASSSSGGSGGGLAIGAPITGGTATRILFEGPGGVLADDARLVQNFTAGADGYAQMSLSHEANGCSLTGYVAFQGPSNYAYLYDMGDTCNATWGGGDGDQLWRSTAVLNGWTSPSGGNSGRMMLLNATGGPLHVVQQNRLNGTTAEVARFGDGGRTTVWQGFRAGSQGANRWTEIDGNGYPVQVAGLGVAFTRGRCTLDGANPSTCSVSIGQIPYGVVPACVCTNEGTTKAKAQQGCAVDPVNLGGSGSVTITSDNGATNAVAVVCW